MHERENGVIEGPRARRRFGDEGKSNVTVKIAGWWSVFWAGVGVDILPLRMWEMLVNRSIASGKLKRELGADVSEAIEAQW